MSLQTLHQSADQAEGAFEAECSKLGTDRWTWYRACAAIDGENIHRNDDTSRDAELAGSDVLRAARDTWMAKLHVFYLARDGEHGFLGGRGL